MSSICPRCHTRVEDSRGDCPTCGANFLSECAVDNTLFYSFCQNSDFHSIRLIKSEDNNKYTSFQLTKGKYSVGRWGATFCLNDAYLSKFHATFSVENDALWVKDENSFNGTFIKINDTVCVDNQTIIRAGNHFFAIEIIEIPQLGASDIPLLMTPHRGAAFRLIELLEGGRCGRAICTAKNTFTVGKSHEDDFCIYGDPYLSPKHFTVSLIDKSSMLITDNHSKNGTFIKIKEKTRLSLGDLVFCGEELFRVEC